MIIIASYSIFFSRSTVRLLIDFLLIFRIAEYQCGNSNSSCISAGSESHDAGDRGAGCYCSNPPSSKNLANYLGKISDTTVEITTGDGTQGIGSVYFQIFQNLTVGKICNPRRLHNENVIGCNPMPRVCTSWARLKQPWRMPSGICCTGSVIVSFSRPNVGSYPKNADRCHRYQFRRTARLLESSDLV